MSDYEEAVKQALKDAEDKAAKLEEDLRENAKRSEGEKVSKNAKAGSEAKEDALKDEAVRGSGTEETVEESEEEIFEEALANGEGTSKKHTEEQIKLAKQILEAKKKAEAEAAKDKKKGIFKKKEEPDKRDEMIEELKDKNARLMAEFENFRKRNEKEKSAMFEVGAKSVIEKMLPVLDNFERGFKTLTDEDKETPFAQGMELVYKQLVSALDEIGVKPIEAVGKEFDPNLHNAVMHEDNEEVGENIVVEEFQKGYTYRDSVVRFSMVKAAN